MIIIILIILLSENIFFDYIKVHRINDARSFMHLPQMERIAPKFARF